MVQSLDNSTTVGGLPHRKQVVDTRFGVSVQSLRVRILLNDNYIENAYTPFAAVECRKL